MATTLLPPPADLLAFKSTVVPPELTLALAPSDTPLALLPVRLETRFFALPGGSQQLRIRVYPDQIHVDSHEPELSADELASGILFWNLTWRAGDDLPRRQLAWQQLADRHDPQRAAWIARALRPLNPQDRPATPLPDNAPLSPPPTFAQGLPQQAVGGGWQRAPLARLMPQRWIAIARSGGNLVGQAFGAPINTPPALGPDPLASAAAAATAGDDAALDPGMRWLVDFEEAERIGMALRMTVGGAVAQAGIDVLLVFGVSSLDADAGAAALAGLIDAHHYTNGCAFVPPGTPTNNTDDVPSGLNTADPLRARSFEQEWQHFGQTLAPASNGATTAAALGLTGDAQALSIGALPHAHDRDVFDARQMAAALWAPTWGYTLTNLIGFQGTGLTPEHIEWAREHFVEHVHAAGALPSLRAGRQPYGLLPVTLLGDWTPAAGEEAAHARDLRLRQLLLDLRERLWRARMPDVARVGRSDNPEADLGAVLRSDGVAASYRTRHLLGEHYLRHLRGFLGEDLAARGWLAAQRGLTGAVTAQLPSLGAAWRPRLAGAAYDERDRALQGSRVQATAGALVPNYIAALLAKPPLPLVESDALPAAAQPAVLLHLLLRHAMQLEYLWAAARLVSTTPGASLTALLHDAELVNLGAARATTWRMLLGRPSPATGGRTPAQFLTSLSTFGGALAPLGRFRAALEHLSTLDTARLDRLLVGTLDTASHRLDAWISSFANKRLAAMRAQRPAGLRVGAYGWVENLKSAAAGTPLPTPAGEAGPVFAVQQDAGFIHAPSVAQAQTAALLRNAHVTHARSNAPSLFAIDLSSRRVRLAHELLEGVRQGQPLGALLGYRFERGLHQRRLDDTIDEFRRLAPLAAANAPSPAAPSADASAESVAARNVVDGLKLQALWDAQRASPTPPFARCAVVLDELGEAIDAVADALVAETAHQAVKGNIARTANSLQAIAAGGQTPPELEFTRTPRSGITVTHRVVLLLPDAALRTRGWPAVAPSPRALAEPRLDAWVARLLGPANAVRLVVERVVGATVTAVQGLRGSELGLRPLDVLALAAAEPGGATPQLDAHVLEATRAKFGPEAAGEVLRIDSRRGSDWAPADRSLDDLRALAQMARRLVGHARALDARDVQAFDAEGDSGVDAAEFEARAERAAQGLAAITAQLAGRVALPERDATAQAAALRGPLAKLMGYGIGAALPSAAAASAADLVTRATLALREARHRVDSCHALGSAADADAAQRASIAAQKLAAIFGNGFVALPRFGVHGNGLKQSLAATEALQGGDAMAVLPWFARMQRVREGVSLLSASLHAAEATGAGERLALKVAQLPHRHGARWAGLPETATQPIAAGQLSVVAQAAEGVDATQPMAGLLIDEWVEQVPARSESTGIAFQHNAPESRAPQALLLAVPPVPGKPWNAWDLHRLLLETLDAARLRTIDAEALHSAMLNPGGIAAAGELSHFLPALYFAVNVEGDSIAPDFGALGG